LPQPPGRRTRSSLQELVEALSAYRAVNASHELDDSRADTVERLARAVESRDANTAGTLTA
jgi:hypothetical protein